MANTRLDEEKAKRTDYILSRASKMKEAKDKYSRNWVKYEKVWKRFEETRSSDDSWRANLPDTWLFASIKTAQAAFVDSQILPVFSKHEGEDSTKHRDLRDLYTDISGKGKMEYQMYFYRLDAFKLGTAFLKTVYVEDKRKVRDIIKFDPKTNETKYKERTRKDFDDPKTMRISPWFMYVDEMCRADFEETCNDCIEIEVLHREDAKRKYGHLVKDWDLIPKTSSLKHLTVESQGTKVAETEDDNTGKKSLREFKFFAPFEISDDQTEILHYWSKSPVDTYEIIINGYGARVETSKTLCPIPYLHKQLPYIPVQYSPHSGDEFWGAGIIEIGLSEAKNVQKHREMMNDRQKISLFAPVFADVDDEIDQKQLKLKPLAVIRTRGGVPKQIQISGATNADFALEDRGAAALKRAVGIDERILGVQGEGAKLTATEVGFLREASLRRLREFSFLLKMALVREVLIKVSLFKQYFSNPLSREQITTDDGLKKYAVKFKRFKVKTGDVYMEKEVRPSFFEGDVDVDIDMRVLLPVTPAEMVAKWGQILRDMLPLVQMGMVNYDMQKIADRYIEALEANPTTLRKEDENDAILMAEGEHKLLADHNTSQAFVDKIQPEGTPLRFLNAAHLKRHEELLENEEDIDKAELNNLIKHIDKDKKNLEAKIKQEQMMMSQMMAGNPALPPGGTPTPPPLQGNQAPGPSPLQDLQIT